MFENEDVFEFERFLSGWIVWVVGEFGEKQESGHVDQKTSSQALE
jgi:hypothetical protein